jgi:molybdopterin molybdotransferase
MHETQTNPHPQQTVDRLIERLAPVSLERVALEHAAGRVLAEPLRSDRDSPPCSVSAMDGYVLRRADLREQGTPVAGEIRIGQAPPDLPQGAALRIVTGAPVPRDADLILRREDTIEEPDRITLRPGAAVPRPHEHIRRQGENLSAGATVIEPGVTISAPVIAAMAAFGAAHVRVFRRVRIGILTTGDELLPVAAEPRPWQIRDSNGPCLGAMFAPVPWLEVLPAKHAVDQPAAIEHVLRSLLEQCDAVFLSGGVSMGQHDHVPQVAGAAGCEPVFHRIPVRPGRPLFGAVGPQGQAVFGLPGNPVSVMAMARRFGVPALARRAGMNAPPPAGLVRIARSDGRTLGLWWYRPVRLVAHGQAELVPGMGSGDVVSSARSDGLVEIPPGADAEGTWPYLPWTI